MKRIHGMILQRSVDQPDFVAPLQYPTYIIPILYFVDCIRRANEVLEFHSSPQRSSTWYYIVIVIFCNESNFILFYRYRQDRGVRGGECKATLNIRDAVAMCRVGKFIVCGIADGTLMVVNPHARKILRQFKAHSKISALIWLYREGDFEKYNIKYA